MMSNDNVIDEEDATVLLKKIIAEAKKDDILSDDEMEIIETVQKHLWDVESEIEVSMQDGKNTPEMIEELRIRLHDILEQAKETANADGKITEEEKSLIDTLDKYVNSDSVTGLLSEYLTKFL